MFYSAVFKNSIKRVIKNGVSVGNKPCTANIWDWGISALLYNIFLSLEYILLYKPTDGLPTVSIWFCSIFVSLLLATITSKHSVRIDEEFLIRDKLYKAVIRILLQIRRQESMALNKRNILFTRSVPSYWHQYCRRQTHFRAATWRQCTKGGCWGRGRGSSGAVLR